MGDQLFKGSQMQILLGGARRVSHLSEAIHGTESKGEWCQL